MTQQSHSKLPIFSAPAKKITGISYSAQHIDIFSTTSDSAQHIDISSTTSDSAQHLDIFELCNIRC